MIFQFHRLTGGPHGHALLVPRPTGTSESQTKPAGRRGPGRDYQQTPAANLRGILLTGPVLLVEANRNGNAR
jgi:hypothetical protein